MSLLIGAFGAAAAAFLAYLLAVVRRQNRALLRSASLLARTGELQAFLAQINQAASQLEEEEAYLRTVCDLAVREGKLALALIGRPDDRGQLQFLAAAGATAYLDGLTISVLPEVPEGQGPAGRVWRGGLPIFNSDFSTPSLAPWRARAERLGLKATAVLPIQRGGMPWALLIFFRRDDVAFDPPMQRLLVQLADDVGRGLDHTARSKRLQLLDRAVAALSEGLTIADGRRDLIFVNRAFAEISGYPPEEAVGRNCNFLQGPQSDPATVEQLRAALHTGESFDGEIVNVRRDGSTFWNHLHIDAVHDAEGRITHYVGIQRDVTERKLQSQRLQRAEAVYRALAATGDSLLAGATEAAMTSRLCQSLIDGTEFSSVWLARPDEYGIFRPLVTSRERADELAYFASLPVANDDADAAIARAWRNHAVAIAEIAIPPLGTEGLGPPRAAAMLAAPVRRGGAVWGVLVLVAERSGLFDDTTRSACERVAALLGHGLDELDRKSALQTLQDTESRRARTDTLTGLPNRLAFDEYLPGALARAARRQTVVAVGMLDLDDFKPVNDRFGHSAGDVLLQKIAQALRARARQSNFLARLGGDEFVLVFEDLEPEHFLPQLQMALERLHAAIEQPFDLGEGRTARVGMTIGFALYPQDAGEPDILLRLADAAMYASKAHKHDRTHWWRIGTSGPDGERNRPPDGVLDLFGNESAALLGSLDGSILDPVASAFAQAFHEGLARKPEQAEILRALTPEESDRLQCSQAEHLLFLMRPDTTREAIEATARALGETHALVGLPNASMEQAFGLYESLLRAQLEAAFVSARERYLIMRVATARLRLDVQIQLAAIDRTIDKYFSLLKVPVRPGARWVDVLPLALEGLGGLPGIRHAIVFRPDEHGSLRIAAGAGEDFGRVADMVRDHDDLRPNLNAGPGMERGPLAMAWFTREVQVVDAYLLDPRLQRWHALAEEMGWRSAATVPIASVEDTDSVLMLFGTHPHQFSSSWAKSWLELLRNRLDTLFAATARGHRLIGPTRVRTLRELLYGDGLSMWVQPIVDLQTGAVVRVEALARLQTPDGEVVNPDDFLPAFGEQELHALFRLGLNQALEHLHAWREAGLELSVAVNLPPLTLSQPDCVSWIEEALRKTQIAASSLTLEILESAELDHTHSGEAMQAIDALGAHLALDDLGSGYGSLGRLASMPIDTVKIDQGLIRELPRDPLRTIRLLSTLVRIGEEFARQTVVEGLEDEGFVEAARLLGARLGQGYALARPMPAKSFPAWMQIRPAIGEDPALHTWPGALAYHWATTHDRLHLRTPGPFESCPLAAFLQRQGLGEPEVLRWHEQIHRSTPGATRDTAARALLEWLVRRVTLAYTR